MHLIVAFAGLPPAAPSRAPTEDRPQDQGMHGSSQTKGMDPARTWNALTPTLVRIAATWARTQVLTMATTSYSAPHEVAWASAAGACTEDGLVPWAAWLARQDGLNLTQACALLAFTHWRVTPQGLMNEHPDALALDAQEATALAQAIEPWTRQAGFSLHHGQQGRLYLSHPDLASLRTASLDRLAGQPVHDWPCQGSLAKAWHTLQNELQMVLHDLELNDARATTRRLVVNSVLLSGAGPRPELSDTVRVVVDESLREAHPGTQKWSSAWQRLEEHEIASLMAPQNELLETTSLTLAGRCGAITLTPPSAKEAPAGYGWLRRWLRSKSVGSDASSAAVKLHMLMQSLDEDNERGRPT